jgi:hypothetical protein
MLKIKGSTRFLGNKTNHTRLKPNFLFPLCIAFIFVVLTPLASFANGTPQPASLFPPILPKQELNIAQITQSLTALTLASALLERAIDIVFRSFLPKEKDEIKQQNTQIIRFFAGLLISAIGVRVLEPLFIAPTADWQLFLFRLLDFLLTGIIISEGSGGVHNLLTSLTAFLDASEKKSKQKIDGSTRVSASQMKNNHSGFEPEQ